MALTAGNLIDEAVGLYNDALQADGDYERVGQAEWIRFLNSALRSLVLVRPDALPKTTSVQLAAGTKQSLPSEAFKLIDITRNMGTDGSTEGKIITPIKRETLDLTNQLWHQGTATTYIDHFTYDEENPRTFYVTPPVHAVTAVYVEMVYSYNPITITATTDAITVPDLFANPLISWMLYRAYSIDDESSDFAKGQAELSTFFNLLQVEAQSSLQTAPSNKE
jgi:hypothetical protein